MSTRPISVELSTKVLSHLSVQVTAPDLSTLDTLIESYTSTVPWESAFRIAKRARTREAADCPRWPAEFWIDNITLGGGGTCFESNYAFFGLLLALGYEGYLTINNMGDSIGCHTAIILHLGGQKWLADVGIPLYVPIRLDSQIATSRKSPFHSYRAIPEGPNRFRIKRSAHPQPYIFTLIDRPVTDEEYRQATAKDYGEDGLFLEHVIVNKIINGESWRFNAGERPWRLNRFSNGERMDRELGIDMAKSLAAHFSLDEETLRQALAATEHK